MLEFPSAGDPRDGITGIVDDELLDSGIDHEARRPSAKIACLLVWCRLIQRSDGY
jgi:hypothetical protein